MLRMFRRFQWRMSFSYIMVTIPLLIFIQICFLLVIGVGFYWFINSQWAAEEQASALTGMASQAAPYLRTPGIDEAGLSDWLEGTMCGGAGEATMFAEDTHPAVRLAAVVDRDGRVLADATGTVTPGTPISQQLEPRALQVLAAALAGNTEPHMLALRQADNAIVAAAPIKDADQRVLGAWVVTVGAMRFFTWPEAIFVLLAFLIPLAILASLFAVGFGSLYGYLTSRELVRRLRSLTTAAESWSAGDFRTLTRDNAGDELGRLSRRLNQMAAQLETLVVTRQDLATLEERNRLARDLHDSVKQQLFAISMQLASARTLSLGHPAADALLAQAETLTQSAQHELTATIQALRPVALRDESLVAALRSYVADWGQRHPIAAEVRCDCEPDLPISVQQVLFRVVQEALANVARHSDAAHVWVTIGTAQDTVLMTVADDGCGFDPAAARPGIGLHSMCERVTASAGTFRLDSQPGQGTQITVELGLSKESRGCKSE